MEGYQTKRQYLRHLKKIAQIREGMGKLPIFNSNLNATNCKSKQRFGPNSKSSILSPLAMQGKTHTSTQRLMRDFTVQKQNMRLVSKILRMNSSIPLKQYEQDYEHSKKYLVKTQQRKRNEHQQYIYLKLYDINFMHGTSSSPQDYYEISLVDSQSKVLLLKGSLFQIRKKELKLKKKKDLLIQIQGRGERGKVKISQQSLLDIKRRGVKVGHVVVQHITK